MMPTDCLYFGDNLRYLRNSEFFPDESVDLIYLDPPFNSNQTYNVLYKEGEGTPSTAQVKAFEDTWYWDESVARALHDLNTEVDYTPAPLVGLLNALEEFLGHSPMYAYLVQIAVRLVELRRALKPTGSLLLHCDPTASHYLKGVLDAIFSARNFCNEIVWHYRRWTAPSRRLQRLHDVILWYTADYGKHTYNTIWVAPANVEKGRREGYEEDETGRMVRLQSLRGQRYEIERDSRGVHAGDVWSIPFIHPSAKERLGYPTQKPLALLKRIVEAYSNPGDIVLDPFCGCGTTIDAVVSINQANGGRNPRRWIGIDITHLAIDLIKNRLAERFGLDPRRYQVIGEPTTLEEARALAALNRYQFQYWALGLIGARPWGDEKKKGMDRGLDGYRNYMHGHRMTYKKCLVQVKSGKASSSFVHDLKGTMEREKADMAVFITLEPATAEMRREAAAAGFFHSEVMNRDYPRLQILSIEELLEHPDSFRIPPGSGRSLPKMK